MSLLFATSRLHYASRLHAAANKFCQMLIELQTQTLAVSCACRVEPMCTTLTTRP